MNKKVEFVQGVFGITLPNFGFYTSGIKIEEIQKEEDGVTYPAKWKHESGVLLPQEFEIYLPKEGMTPEQAAKQLEVCSGIARGWMNDSFKLYSQKIMMQFISNAVINCIYLASKNFNAWIEKDTKDKSYLSKIDYEINIFNDAFSKERPYTYSVAEKMCFPYLRLLLENNYNLNKGTDMGNGDIFYNTLFNNLFSNFTRTHSNFDSPIARSISRMLQKKCYEVTEELEKMK